MFPFLPIYNIFHSERNFHTRKVIDDLPEYEVKKHCGMSTTAVKQLSTVFTNLRSTHKSAIPLETQLLAYLSYLRSGGFQWCVGSLAGVSQPSCSRIIESFTNEVISRTSDFIYYPQNLVELQQIKEGFYEIKQFPNVIGAVDGTHIGIKAPFESSFAFVNRKQFHSINLQVICDSNRIFLDAVAKWPGSTHDSFIWRNSSIRSRFIAGEFGRCWLLGDSGYPLENILLTPYPTSSRDPVEVRYNKAHCSTRCTVERAIGTWMARFRSMCKTGGFSCYSESKVCKLAIASICLHNYCRRARIPLTEEDEEFLSRLQPDTHSASPPDQPSGSTDIPSTIRRNVALNLPVEASP